MADASQKTKGLFHQIGGTIVAVLGGVSILAGGFVLFGELLSGLPNWYEGTLLCFLPSWLVGIPLLIFGLRRIANKGPKTRTEAEILARKNTMRLVWSWVFAIAGGLLTLLGVVTLYMTLVFINSANWDPSYFVFSLICIVSGVPLLMVGFRRLKSVPGYRDLNWGWAALIAGGLLAAAGIYFLLIYIFVENAGPFLVWLEIIAPLFVLGMPILLLGVRRMKKTSDIELINPDALPVKEKKQLVWGWILLLMGGLTILGSLIFLISRYYSIFIKAPLNGDVEAYTGYYGELLMIVIMVLVMPLLVVGISLLVPGAILLKRTPISRQSRGWVLLLLATLFLLAVVAGLSYVGNSTYKLIIYTAIYSSLFLITGLLCFFFGLSDVRHEASLPANPGGWTGQTGNLA